MPQIHDDLNKFIDENPGASVADQSNWLSAQGVDPAQHKAVRATARTYRSRAAARTLSINDRRDRMADVHDVISHELQNTPHPVKVEFPTGEKSRSNAWTDRMVPAHAVPRIAAALGTAKMALTFFDHDGTARTYRLSRPQEIAGQGRIAHPNHATGGRLFDQVPDFRKTKGYGNVPFTVTPNVNDLLDLEHRNNAVNKAHSALASADVPSVEVPDDIQRMNESLDILRGMHAEQLSTIETKDQLDAGTPVVGRKHIRAALGLARSLHEHERETNPEYAAQIASAESAVAKRTAAEAKLAEVTSSRDVLQKRVSQHTASTLAPARAPADLETLIHHGIDPGQVKMESSARVASDKRGNFPVPENLIDYVRTAADTSTMRQARGVMHLAKAAGASGTDPEAAATHARRAEAAMGVQWEEPSRDSIRTSMPMAPQQIALSDESGELGRSSMAARVAGQMRHHPLYAGTIGTGLAKAAKAQGAQGIGPRSRPEKIAGAMEAVHSAAAAESPTIGYPQKQYIGGASANDPMPPYRGMQDEATSSEPEFVQQSRNETRSGLSTLIGARTTRESRRRG